MAHKTEEGINVLVVKAKKVIISLFQILNQDKTVYQSDNLVERTKDQVQLNESNEIKTNSSNYEQIVNNTIESKIHVAEKLDNQN